MADLFRRHLRMAEDYELRPVRPDDAERIRRILQVAFEDENRRMGLKNIRLPVMRRQLLDFYLDRNPEASVVATGKGGAVGFTLACRWGSVAWLGPVAVLPPVQGIGLGRRMVTAASEALLADGVTTLGVETMPRSFRNLQFYSRLGLRFSGLTLDLSRLEKEGADLTPGPGAGGPEVVRLSEVSGRERKDALRDLAGVSGRVAPGLDYTSEALKTARHKLGDTLILRWGSAVVGFAILHIAPYAEEEIPGTVRVNTLLAVPPVGESDPVGVLEHLLDAIEREACRQDCNALTFRVPSWVHPARDALLARGFHITHSDVRMTWARTPERDASDVIHLSKWE
jgi:predicted N-acetyltransferase YhbS